MIKRRDLMKLGTVSAGVCLTSMASACSFVEYTDDEWGAKLIKFFKSGNATDIEGLLAKGCHLVAFEDCFIEEGDSPLYYKDREDVTSALQSFRRYLVESYSYGRIFIDAKIIGNKQDGRLNKIELIFAEPEYTETSCGPTRSEIRYDLFYQADSYEYNSIQDSVKRAIMKLSIMPKLYEERAGDV